MGDSQASAPVWLFSFVDLAFLLLIAMTQVGVEQSGPLGELAVPKVVREGADALRDQASERPVLRVHGPDAAGDEAVFELLFGDESGLRLDAAALGTRLAALHEAGVGRPTVAPDPESRSRDLLDAVGRVEALWPERRALVRPLLGSP
jgi:hypothetical protein